MNLGLRLRRASASKGWGRSGGVALAIVAVLAAPLAAQPESDARVHPGELLPLPELPLYFEDPAAEPAEPPTDADDIVSGAARREQSLGNVASAVTVISADRLRRFGYRTVAEAIAGVAGVHLVDDRLATRVGIRGMQPIGDFNTRILVVIDGTSMTEAWSHLSGVGYDLPLSIDEVERIEVIRGPVSSIYGTNAFFGIINIITRGALTKLQAWGRASAGQIGGLGGSAGFAAGTPRRQVRGAVSVVRRRGERIPYQLGEDAPLSLARDTDTGLALAASLSAALGPTFAQLRAYSSQRLVPFAPYGGSFDTPYEQLNRQISLDVGHALVWRKWQWSGRLFASAYRFSDRASQQGDEEYRLSVEGNARTIGAELRGRYPVLEDNLLWATTGIESTYNDTFHSWQEVPTQDRDDGGLAFGLLGLYAELESVPAPWLGLTAGVRFDRHSVFSKDGNLSPRLALFLSPSPRAGVKLLYAQGFRNPSTYEAEYEDEDIEDNSGLRPETIESFEVVAWAKPTPALSLRASGYRWNATGVLKQRQVVVESVPKVQYQNSGSYRSLGLELEARLRDPGGFFAYAAANFAAVEDEKLNDEGAAEVTRLAGAPRVTASAGVSSPPLWAGLTLSTELSFISERTTAAAGRSSGRHVAWNAVLYLPPWRGFDLTLGARNLLGSREAVPAAEDFTYQDELVGTVPGEGRELYVRLGRSL